MNKILVALIFSFILCGVAYSHSEIQMLEVVIELCNCKLSFHKTKQTNPYQTYYYIKYQGQTYGPYSSYSSCMGAIRGAGVYGAYCSTSKY